MIRRTALIAVIGFAASAGMASAEVKIQEKTQFKFGGFLGSVMNMFGGKAAKEGVPSSVAVKGDRRATIGDVTGEIVDLREEKIYELDMKKKTYKVTTFAEYRQRMKEEEEKAAKAAPPEAREEIEVRAEQKAEPGQKPQEQQVEVDFDLKETGQTRSLNGFDTRQVVMTVALREKGKTLEQSGGLVLTSDMWLTPTVKGNQELMQFEQRYIEKLHGPTAAAAARAQLAMLFATYPQLKQGMGRMTAESAKLDGTPISSSVTIEAVKGAQAREAEAQQKQQQQQQEEAPKGLGGMLARKMGKKKEADPAAKPGRSLLMTTTHEITSVSPTVSEADLAVPQGFDRKSD
jgi:hypothetical protein